MMMNEGIDTGDILLVEKVKLDSKETGGSLFDKLSGVGAALLVKTLDELEKGTVKPALHLKNSSHRLFLSVYQAV